MTICTNSLSSSESVRLENIEPFTLHYLDQSWVTSWKRVLRERCKRDEDDWDPRWWMGILKGKTLRIFLAIPDKQSLLGVYTGTAWRWRFRLCRQVFVDSLLKIYYFFIKNQSVKLWATWNWASIKKLWLLLVNDFPIQLKFYLRK